MSKKNRNKFQSQGSSVGSSFNSSGLPTAESSHTAEYRIITNDLLRVLILNIVFFGLVMAVYLTDRQSHYLERMFHQIFKI